MDGSPSRDPACPRAQAITTSPEVARKLQEGMLPAWNPMYSPEDECMTCRVETMAPVNTVRTARLPLPKKEEPRVFVKSLTSKGAIPQLAHQGDAGYDLRSIEDICLAPEETVLVHTGLAM